MSSSQVRFLGKNRGFLSLDELPTSKCHEARDRRPGPATEGQRLGAEGTRDDREVRAGRQTPRLPAARPAEELGEHVPGRAPRLNGRVRRCVTTGARQTSRDGAGSGRGRLSHGGPAKPWAAPAPAPVLHWACHRRLPVLFISPTSCDGNFWGSSFLL